MKMTEEQRQIEIRALEKERAANNARIKADLAKLGRVGERKSMNTPNTKQQMLEMRSDFDKKLEHILDVIRYQQQPHMNPPHGIMLSEKGMPHANEILKVRAEVEEMQGMLTMIAKYLSSQNVSQNFNLQPAVHNLAHMEAVACCQARQQYGAVQHQFVPNQPQLVMTPTGLVDDTEVEKVKKEVVEVKEVVKGLAKAFESYNFGMMHGKVDSLVGQQAQQAFVPQQLQQQPQFVSPSQPVQEAKPKSGGLAEALAKMSNKLDALDREMKSS